MPSPLELPEAPDAPADGPATCVSVCHMPYMTRWTLKKSSAPKAIHGHATLSVWMKFWRATKIIEQLIDNIPEGAYQEKMKPIIRVPEGTYYAAVEGSRGEFGVFLESHGDKMPYRLHFRSTGLPLVSTVIRFAAELKSPTLLPLAEHWIM